MRSSSKGSRAFAHDDALGCKHLLHLGPSIVNIRFTLRKRSRRYAAITYNQMLLAGPNGMLPENQLFLQEIRVGKVRADDPQ